MQCSGVSFCTLLWSNYQLLSKFHDLLLFFPCLRARKASRKMFVQVLTEKLNDFRVTSTFYYHQDFCGKPPTFLTKSCLAIRFQYFLFNWRGINPSVTFDKIYRKRFFLLYIIKNIKQKEKKDNSNS